MNIAPEFKKSLLISFIGHIAIFSIFTLSFGRVLPSLNYTRVNFWGQYLQSSQVSSPIAAVKNRIIAPAFNSIKVYQPPSERQDLALKKAYFKPESLLTLKAGQEKSGFSPALRIIKPNIRSSTITLHPVLPYDFRIYFKDRQVAHVELMFRIDSRERRNSIIVKRKVSSGNLDADLICIRNISQYLLRHQANFPANEWQTVKIDLSAQQ